MRRRAAEVSLSNDDERLPLPAAHDEIRRLGETLNDMLDRLRGSFERERQFVADASHELRTPVAVIKTELEGALRTGDYGPHVREALVAAVEECDHLAQMADDLLIIARAGEGELPVRREAVVVSALFEGVREHFIDRATQHGRAIRIELPRPVEVRADALRLGQALGNLVDNALRYGAGDIVLRARRAPGGVVLEVSDQGPGFAPDIAGRAFERFARGDGARTARWDGPGDGDRPRRGRGARGLDRDRRGRRRHRGALAAPGRGAPAALRGARGRCLTRRAASQTDLTFGPYGAGHADPIARPGPHDRCPRRWAFAARPAAGERKRQARSAGLHDQDRQPLLADDPGQPLDLPRGRRERPHAARDRHGHPPHAQGGRGRARACRA